MAHAWRADGRDRERPRVSGFAHDGARPCTPRTEVPGPGRPGFGGGRPRNRHDWRHDWAARMVMTGADLYTLRTLGGWSSLRMVERYASVTAAHLTEAVRRLA
ncbi:MAG: tyrosine-type recombinase/integrase [Acetobacteraceae bacterium]